jgi:hypothetical protein
MNLAKASKVHRKSGVRFGEPRGTRPVSLTVRNYFCPIPTLFASNWDLNQHDPKALCRCRYHLVRLVRTFFQNLGGHGLQG